MECMLGTAQKSRPNCQSLTNHASTIDKRFKANAGAKT